MRVPSSKLLIGLALTLPIMSCAALASMQGGNAESRPNYNFGETTARSVEEVGGRKFRMLGMNAENCREFRPTDALRIQGNAVEMLERLEKDLLEPVSSHPHASAWARYKLAEANAQYENVEALSLVLENGITALVKCGWEVRTPHDDWKVLGYTWHQSHLETADVQAQTVVRIRESLALRKVVYLAELRVNQEQRAAGSFLFAQRSAAKKMRASTCKGKPSTWIYFASQDGDNTNYYFCDGVNVNKRKDGTMGYSSGSLDSHPKWASYIKAEGQALDRAREDIKELGKTRGREERLRKASRAYQGKMNLFVQKYRPKAKYYRVVKSTKIKPVRYEAPAAE